VTRIEPGALERWQEMGTRMEQRNVIKQRRKDGNEQEDTPEAET
jgi:hypothetical protein